MKLLLWRFFCFLLRVCPRCEQSFMYDEVHWSNSLCQAAVRKESKWEQ